MSNVINTVPFAGSSTRPGALISTESTGHKRLYSPGLHKTGDSIAYPKLHHIYIPIKITGKKRLS